MSSAIHQLRITLDGSKPPIWRKLAVPSDITLGNLHDVVQIVMGWTDDHLHQFILHNKRRKPSPQEITRQIQQGNFDEAFMDRMGGRRVFVTTLTPWGEPSGMDGEDEDAVTLGELCPKVKSKLTYEYDFGDGWEHTIEVQKIGEGESGVAYPVCLGGKQACPPEDCGGIWGYCELIEAISDPKHERHNELLEWLGGRFDPDAFDLEEVNAMLAQRRR